MKWIVLIVILLAIVAVVGLRMSRQGHSAPRGSHHPDREARPPSTPGHQPDMPGTTDASFISGTGSPGTGGPSNPDVDWGGGDSPQTPPEPTDPGGRGTT